MMYDEQANRGMESVAIITGVNACHQEGFSMGPTRNIFNINPTFRCL